MKAFRQKLKETLQESSRLIKYVLMSNNPNEQQFNKYHRTDYFLNKVFGKDIVTSNIFRVYTMSLVTEKQLHGRLKEVAEMEGVRINSDTIDAIIKSSNKDVRNSILTLGMEIISIKSTLFSNKKSKIDKDDISQNLDVHSKDSSIGIFHTIGKFLYNKSIIFVNFRD